MVAEDMGESQETSRDDFEKALQNLAQIPVVGLTDYYGVSLCLLLYRLGRRKEFYKGCRCDTELRYRANDGSEKRKERADPGEMLFEYGTFAEVRKGIFSFASFPSLIVVPVSSPVFTAYYTTPVPSLHL
jgi:hypothetical protein